MGIIVGGAIVQSEWRILDGYSLGLFTSYLKLPIYLKTGSPIAERLASSISLSEAITVLTVYGVISLAAAYTIFQRRDVLCIERYNHSLRNCRKGQEIHKAWSGHWKSNRSFLTNMQIDLRSEMNYQEYRNKRL